MTAHADGSLWYYAPNKAAPIVFANLFAISCAFHICNCLKYKSWKLAGVLPFGTAMLVAGFALRAVGAWQYDNLNVFIASTVLIVMGPPVYAAHLYIVLGRSMYYIPWLAPMHPGRVMTTFLGLDVICEAVLASGVSRSSNADASATEQQIGVDLLRAGLILQVIMFVCYLGLAVHFHMTCAKNGVASKLRGVMIVLYVTGVLILERSAYRVAEYFEGYKGTVYRTEPLFWVFEASAMLVVSFTLNFWPPAGMLPRSSKVYLATDGVTEREGPGWVDERPFIVTFLDPFDLVSLCTRRRAYVKFWENDEGLVVNTKETRDEAATSPA